MERFPVHITADLGTLNVDLLLVILVFKVPVVNISGLNFNPELLTSTLAFAIRVIGFIKGSINAIVPENVSPGKDATV